MNDDILFENDPFMMDMLYVAEDLYLTNEGSPITSKKFSQALDYYLGEWAPDQRIYVFSPQSKEVLIEVLPTDKKSISKAKKMLKLASKEGGSLMIGKYEQIDEETIGMNFEDSLICDPY